MTDQVREPRWRGLACAEAVARIVGGDPVTAGLLLRDLDDDLPSVGAVVAMLFARGGRAQIVGLTGPAGSGKSTLTDALITSYRKSGCKVAVVAVDPSSPVSGGALLGDRIRMNNHATDPGVFIRSLATRGAMGGLSASVADSVTVMDAMGFDVVIVETVGVGQDEVDVVRLADVVLVVSVPGLGDEIQALKAGLLEVADILVVNKADRDGAERTVADLRMMLQLREGGPGATEIVRTVGSTGEGISDVREAVVRFVQRQEQSGAALARRRAQSAHRIRAGVLAALARRAEAAMGTGILPSLVDAVAARTLSPADAVGAVLAEMESSP